jgi:hypothetical protein
MPDPKSLKVDDLVRFVSLPEEWSRPGYTLLPESRLFMRKMIQRCWPSRVHEVDEYGNPWIHARVRERGKYRFHSWAVLESTGWRRVKRRK